MNCELQAIAKVIKSANPELEFKKITETDYGHNCFVVYQKQFEWIKEFRSKFNKLPDEQTFLTEFKGVELPEAPEPVSFYLDEMKKSFVFQNISRISGEVIKFLGDKDPLKAMEYMHSELGMMKNTVRVSKDIDLKANLADRLKEYEAKKNSGNLVTGIPTGWSKVDNETTGWQKGEMSLLAGRPYSYKTWFLIFWSLHAWEKGYNVLFFSKEMGFKQITRRIDAYLAKTRFKDLKTCLIKDDIFDQFKDELSKKFLNPWNPFFKIIDSSGRYEYEIDLIRDKIREYKPDVVYIDGVYLFRGKGNSEWEKQRYVSNNLKDICISEDIPIIGTIQLNRGKKKGGAQGEDIAYSDAWTQDADNILGLTRIWDKVEEDWTYKVKVDGIKFRDAEPMKFILEVDLDRMMVHEDSNQMLDVDIDSSSLDEGDTILL